MFSTEILVKDALATTLNLIDMTHINVNQRLWDDLRLDSASSLMFLMKFEELIEGFFVDPETLETKDLETVSSVIRYIDTQLLSKNAHLT